MDFPKFSLSLKMCPVTVFFRRPNHSLAKLRRAFSSNLHSFSIPNYNGWLLLSLPQGWFCCSSPFPWSLELFYSSRFLFRRSSCLFSMACPWPFMAALDLTLDKQLHTTVKPPESSKSFAQALSGAVFRWEFLGSFASQGCYGRFSSCEDL